MDKKKCYNCGKIDHLQKDCTATRAEDQKCFICGSGDHFARDCRAEKQISESICYNCGGRGHLSYVCPSEFKKDTALQCYTCEKFGHLAKNCPTLRTSEQCFSCGRTGHIAKNCMGSGGRRRQRSRSPGRRGSSPGRTRSGSGGARVYVGNLSYETTWQSLKDHMGTIGRVNHADVIMNSDGRSAGGGIVEYVFASDAQAAMKELTDTELDGRLIFVREDREEKANNGGRSGNGVSLYVGNVPFSCTWQNLKDLFTDYGVVRADVAQSDTGKSKGYGIVILDNRKHAQEAIGCDVEIML